ncbi:MAG: Ig-like domain-containing protein [Verrucomicrobiota bacterium]
MRYSPIPSAQLQNLSREEAFLDTFEVTITDDETGSVKSWVAVLVVGVNDQPDAIDDLASTNEDTPVTINPVVNDVDPDEDGPLPNNILRLVPENTFTAYGAKVTIGTDFFTYDPTSSAYLQGLAVGQTATESVPTTTMDGSFVFANDDEFQVAADDRVLFF